MTKEASIAPKERVNIVYKVATGNVQKDVELPLKQLVLGEFTDKFADKRVEEREITNIDKDNFNKVLDAYDVNVQLAVPNKLSEAPDEKMNVTLDFKTMRDFEPEAISSKVPELKKLLELREALVALKGPLSNVPKFRNKLQALVGDGETRAKLLAELGLNQDKE